MRLNHFHKQLRHLAVPFLCLPLAINTSSAAAIDFSYGVAVDIQSGSLTGQTLNGQIGFDNAQVTGAAFEEVEIGQFSFTFDGTEYNETDDSFAFAEFENGTLTGLSYAIFGADPFQPVFTFESFFGSQFFDYTDPTGFGNDGSGDVTFTLLTDASDPVPEPSTLIGTSLMLGFAYLFYRHRQQAQA